MKTTIKDKYPGITKLVAIKYGLNDQSIITAADLIAGDISELPNLMAPDGSEQPPF